MQILPTHSGRFLLSIPCIVAAFAAYAPIASASNDSSWSDDNSPSWADKDATPPPRLRNPNSSSQRYARPSNISPFSPGSNNVSLEMGQVFLMGGLSNNFSDSIGTSLHYTYGVSDIFDFDSALGYSNHSDGAFSMTSFQAGLRTNLAWYDKVIPYFSFGLGFYRPSYSLGQMGLAPASSEASLSPLLFGVHLGPGVDLEVTKQIFFGASLTFNDVFGKTEATPGGTPFDTGGTYTAFFLHAGMTF
jgi:hypothetical protein